MNRLEGFTKRSGQAPFIFVLLASQVLSPKIYLTSQLFLSKLLISAVLFKMIFTTLLTLALITVSLAIPAPVHLDRSLHTLSLPIRRDTTGTAPVYAIDRGIRWVVNISLGGQHLNVLLDTGSSPLWALSTFMSPEDHNRLPNHTWYNANASSTWQHTSGSFNVSYGDGSNKVEAIIGKEKVSLGGISTVMPIGACNYTTNSADTMGNDTDGILGLGFGEADESQYHSIKARYTR